MDTLQIRLNHGLIERVDSLVKEGIYANRSDVIRDAVRRFVWKQELGSISSSEISSVDEVRKLRKKHSSEEFDLSKLNDL